MRISLKHVEYAYPCEQPVLKEVSLEYCSPETLCLLGSNGAGKSTLLQCIIGTFIPTKGSVSIEGAQASAYALRDLARLIAYIPQTHQPTFAYPVIDVVMMGRTSLIGRFATPSKKDEQIAYEKLDFLGIGALCHKPYIQISGGERQLVMIAAALAQEPQLLVLDEPTAHLDFGNQYRFIELVKQLSQSGIGVLMTTHTPDHALMLAGPTALLHNGCITHTGIAREVVTSENLAPLYDIEVHVQRIGKRFICVPGSLDE